MSDTYRDRVHAELSDLTYRGVQMSPAEAAIYTKAVLAIRDDELARVRSELAELRDATIMLPPDWVVQIEHLDLDNHPIPDQAVIDMLISW